MHVFCSEAHHAHNPPYEILEGGISLSPFDLPARVTSVLIALRDTNWATLLPPREFGLAPIEAVHPPDYLEFLRTAFERWQQEGGQLGPDRASPVLYAATFPPRRSQGKPKSVVGLAGYYAMDLSAAITLGTYSAILAGAQCALSAAQAVLDGEQVAFAICRPPGHHAGRDYGGGYCLLNNTSIAARFMSTVSKQRVAILDVDYHAGNGTQDIFYASPEVLTISLHADPSYQYPFYMGYADETGDGPGLDFHRNFPLPAGTSDDAYLRAVTSALTLIRDFNPTYLVVAAGMDIYHDDPLGNFAVTTAGIRQIGEQIASLAIPTMVVMEGGYYIPKLGENFLALLTPFTK